MQNGCKNVLPICYQNDLNMCNVNAADSSAAFVVTVLGVIKKFITLNLLIFIIDYIGEIDFDNVGKEVIV